MKCGKREKKKEKRRRGKKRKEGKGKGKERKKHEQAAHCMAASAPNNVFYKIYSFCTVHAKKYLKIFIMCIAC